MAKDTALVVEPPQMVRRRESSADPETVKDMADTIKTAEWVTNGDVYDDHKSASLDANVYKRAVAREMKEPDHKFRTRIWGMRGNVVELDTDAKGAKWRFAVKHDPERVKTVRKQS